MVIIVSILVVLLMVISCKKQLETMEKVEIPTETTTKEATVVQTVVPTVPEKILAPTVTTPVVCTLNSECAGGSYCISQKCTSLDSLVNTTCDVKCTTSEVVIETSDGKSYTLPPGKGDYTAAGAIDWTILRTPPHCKGSLVRVPITIFKRNYGKTLGDEAIILLKGETSAVITHPINKKVAFTITVKDVVESC